jgi:hypothetical protein
MTKEIISTENAPKAIGTYSQAIKKKQHCFFIWANWLRSKDDGISRWNRKSN